MKKLPIDLPLRQVTTKVSVDAWDRAQQLKDAIGCRLSDVLSAALLTMDEAKLKAIIEDQEAALAAMPKAVKDLLKNMDTLSDADRAALKQIL